MSSPYPALALFQDESSDVELACKSMPIGKIYPYGNLKVTCDVERDGTIDQDFAAMLAADVGHPLPSRMAQSPENKNHSLGKVRTCRFPTER